MYSGQSKAWMVEAGKTTSEHATKRKFCLKKNSLLMLLGTLIVTDGYESIVVGRNGGVTHESMQLRETMIEEVHVI